MGTEVQNRMQYPASRYSTRTTLCVYLKIVSDFLANFNEEIKSKRDSNTLKSHCAIFLSRESVSYRFDLLIYAEKWGSNTALQALSGLHVTL